MQFLIHFVNILAHTGFFNILTRWLRDYPAAYQLHATPTTPIHILPPAGHVIEKQLKKASASALHIIEL